MILADSQILMGHKIQVSTVKKQSKRRVPIKYDLFEFYLEKQRHWRKQIQDFIGAYKMPTTRQFIFIDFWLLIAVVPIKLLKECCCFFLQI